MTKRLSMLRQAEVEQKLNLQKMMLGLLNLIIFLCQPNQNNKK